MASSDAGLVQVPAAELERLKAAEEELRALRASLADRERGLGQAEGWKVGDKPAKPFTGKHVSLDAAKVPGGCYQLAISSVLPRPIAFVASLGEDGVANLSPFSYFGLLGHSPPCVAIGVADLPGGAQKDTIVNVTKSGEFTINIISEWMLDAANATAGGFPANVDEFRTGLTKAASVQVKAPRVEESACSFECKVHEIKRIGTTQVVIGEIVQFHVQEELLDTSRESPSVRFEGYRPVARLGGVDYASLGSVRSIPRPAPDAHKDWPNSAI